MLKKLEWNQKVGFVLGHLRKKSKCALEPHWRTPWCEGTAARSARRKGYSIPALHNFLNAV